MGRITLYEEIKNGAEIQKIIFFDEKGKKIKIVGPREEIAEIYKKIEEKKLKWIMIKKIRGPKARILKLFFEIKEITKKTCHFGYLDKGD